VLEFLTECSGSQETDGDLLEWKRYRCKLWETTNKSGRIV